MGCTGLKVGKRLEDFLSFYDEAIKVYNFCYEKVNECEKLECDLKHKLELGNYADVNEERRILTQLKYCLRDRRYYKDRVEELGPFVELFYPPSAATKLEGLQFKRLMDQIKGALGAIRRAEEYHKSRTYKPRILKDDFTFGG